MTIEELRNILEKAIAKLGKFNDDDEVVVKPNTYFLGDCATFLGLSGDGYVNLDKIDVDRVKNVHLTDVDLCITLNDEDNPEGLKTFDELHALGIDHSVVIALESKHSESGWPSFSFDGLEPNVREVLKELGFDEEQIDDMVGEEEE